MEEEEEEEDVVVGLFLGIRRSLSRIRWSFWGLLVGLFLGLS